MTTQVGLPVRLCLPLPAVHPLRHSPFISFFLVHPHPSPYACCILLATLCSNFLSHSLILGRGFQVLLTAPRSNGPHLGAPEAKPHPDMERLIPDTAGASAWSHLPSRAATRLACRPGSRLDGIQSRSSAPQASFVRLSLLHLVTNLAPSRYSSSSPPRLHLFNPEDSYTHV